MASGLVSSLLSSASCLLAVLRSSSSALFLHSDHPTVSADLQRLERLLSRIQVTLDNAEEQEIQDNYVKLWLTELKDLALNAENVLDDYRYELLWCQVQDREACTSLKRKHMDYEKEEEDSIIEVTRKMKISDIRLITEYGVENFMAVEHLTIEKCSEIGPKLLCSPKSWLPSELRFLQFSFCSLSGVLHLHKDLVMLSRLEIRNCPKLDSLIGLHAHLQVLFLVDCPLLDLSPETKFPEQLSCLVIRGCHKLQSLHLLMNEPSFLRELEISDCRGLMHIGGLFYYTELESLTLSHCPLLQLRDLMPAVPETAMICCCPRLKKWCKIHGIEHKEAQHDGLAPC